MNSADSLQNQKDGQADAQRDGWNAEEVGNEASQKDKDEVQKEMKRGDETQDNPDSRDVAGSVDSKDTPQGREEAKNDTEGKANDNG